MMPKQCVHLLGGCNSRSYNEPDCHDLYSFNWLPKIFMNTRYHKTQKKLSCGEQAKSIVLLSLITNSICFSFATNVVRSNPAAHGRFIRYNIMRKQCQWLATGRWISPGTPVSSTNKTSRHDITEILLKMVINTITLTLFMCICRCLVHA